MININSHNTIQNMVITRDGEVTSEYEPSGLNLAAQAVVEGVSRAIDHIKLETRMAAFDVRHGTSYRRIRHQLLEEKRRREFEQSIGLVAVR